MTETRRRMLAAFVGTAFFLPTKPFFGWLQDNGRVIKPHPYPDGRDPSAPAALDPPSQVNPKGLEMERQKEFRANVAKLYDLAAQLKEEVEKTNASAMLSLTVMKKAQQIEKLAKEIKNSAKG